MIFIIVDPFSRNIGNGLFINSFLESVHVYMRVMTTVYVTSMDRRATRSLADPFSSRVAVSILRRVIAC